VRSLRSLLLIAVVLGQTIAVAAPARAGRRGGEFPIPSPDSAPFGITAGPDGNLWFAEYNIGKVGRMTTSGIFTEFSISTPDGDPYRIATGPDGNLWFTETLANNIGRITIVGVFSEYPVPTASSYPYDIAAGPDGNLWFTEFYGNKIHCGTSACADANCSRTPVTPEQRPGIFCTGPWPRP
jgi:streptogramin lyase